MKKKKKKRRRKRETDRELDRKRDRESERIKGIKVKKERNKVARVKRKSKLYRNKKTDH